MLYLTYSLLFSSTYFCMSFDNIQIKLIMIESFISENIKKIGNCKSLYQGAIKNTPEIIKILLCLKEIINLGYLTKFLFLILAWLQGFCSPGGFKFQIIFQSR